MVMGKYNKHIIIVGSARSGTSWLCELMARPFRYRLLFEPEHEFNTKYGHLLCDRLIKDSRNAEKVHNYLKKVFLNRVDNDWIAQLSNRKWKRHLWPFVPKRFIIKFVRCNLAAKYMNDTFGIPVIHLVRNPFDVIESQQRVRFPWLYDLKHFKAQQVLVAYVKQRYNFDLTNTTYMADVELLALRWCLENVVALDFNKERGPDYRLLKFEDLRNDRLMFTRLCNELNLKIVEDIDVVFNMPSSKAHQKGLMGNKPRVQGLNQKELDQISGLLQTFGLDFYPVTKNTTP